MRVTRAIREYVEEEINKKYSAVINKIGADYNAEKDKVRDGVLAIMEEANKKALDYIHECGFDHNGRYYNNNNSVFELRGYIEKPDEEDRLNNERSLLRDSMQKKIKQVLFDLEMGDTEKAQLKDVLDGITVD